MNAVEGWTLGLAEDVDLPGWVFLPEGFSRRDQDSWLADVTGVLSEILNSEQPNDVGATEDEVRTVLAAGLAARAESESYAMYQIWPLMAPAAVMCHVNVVASADLPDWSKMDGTLHAAEARHVGPGLQYSTRRQVEGEDGLLDLNSVHFVFDDGDIALMINLEESLSPLISRALVGLTLFKDALRLERGDGTAFTSTPPGALIEDSPWPLGEA